MPTPEKAKTKKALPVPDDKPRKKRGGKRARKLKEKFGMSEMRKDANKRTFSNFEGEYGDDAMGLDMGMLGKGAGKLRASVKKEQKMALKKAKKVMQVCRRRARAACGCGCRCGKRCDCLGLFPELKDRMREAGR